MKRLNPVGINIENCMDADDYGQRLVDCINQMPYSTNVVNLVKINLGDNITVDKLNYILKDVVKKLREMGANNCVFVPIKKGFIEDVNVDHIEVIEDTADNRTDTETC